MPALTVLPTIVGFADTYAFDKYGSFGNVIFLFSLAGKNDFEIVSV